MDTKKDGKNVRTSNLAVDRPVAERVRIEANRAGVSVLDMATALLRQSLDQGIIRVRPKEIEIVFKGDDASLLPRPRRGRPPKKQ